MAGEMAKMQNISKQTLIYYDKIGLFQPCEIDPHTGYRYYAIEQWQELEIILCLKNLGMQLKEIKAYLNNTPKKRLKILEDQEAAIQKKITAIQTSHKRVKNIISSLHTSLTVTPFKGEIIWGEAMPVLHLPIQSPNDSQAMLQTLKNTVMRTREDPEFLIKDLFYLVNDEDPENPHFPRAIMATDPENAKEVIPKGYWARLYHEGNFTGLKESRQLLKAFIREHGYQTSGLILEQVMFSTMITSKEKAHCIEIRMPVTRPTCPPETELECR